MWLHPSVSINGKTVAMDLDRASINGDVALYQGQMDVKSVRVTCESGCQLGRSNARQIASLTFANRPIYLGIVPLSFRPERL
jgi:hypothetical protein